MYKTLDYKTWDEFKCYYCKDIYGDRFIPGKYIFRGQSDSDWSLISSFDRTYFNLSWKEKQTIEKELLERFNSNCRHQISSLLEPMTETQIKSVAQHYGLPTRLLDWTYSPFIAAYFAFSTINHSKPSHKIAIWALEKDHEIWQSNIGVEIKEEIVSKNDHQKKQLGCFFVLNNQEFSIDAFENSCQEHGSDTQGALIKITIPSTQFKYALRELDAMNINASTIFGGYNGCAQDAKEFIALKHFA